MRQILIVLGALFITLLANAATIAEERALTVLVSNEGFTNGSRGSGLLLDETHVLTCAHLIDTKRDVFFIYTYPLGHVVKAHAEYADQSADLAVLVLDTPVILVAYPRFEHHFSDGDPVTVIGNALGAMSWLISRGIVSGEDRGFLITDAHINHGNSGGPWFDADGSVLGLSDWIIQPESGPGVAGGIPASAIEDFLASREAAQHWAEKMSKLLGA